MATPLTLRQGDYPRSSEGPSESHEPFKMKTFSDWRQERCGRRRGREMGRPIAGPELSGTICKMEAPTGVKEDLQLAASKQVGLSVQKLQETGFP